MEPAETKRRNWVIVKTDMRAPKQDATYWRSQSFSARLAALEEIRREFHHWKYGVQPRFQRVYSIIKR
jgi:hypothetical protein